MIDVSEIYWDPIVFQGCAANITTVISTVTVTALITGEPAGRVLLTGETSAVILNTIPNQEYKVSVEVQVSLLDAATHSCDIGDYQEITFQTPRQDQNTICSKYCTACYYNYLWST